MSREKSTTGALDILVPTPKASTRGKVPE